MSQVDLASIIPLFLILDTTLMIELIATTLYVYDYFLTFSQEVSCIWNRRFSGASLLFMINRYLVLANRLGRLTQMVSWSGWKEDQADHSCDVVWRIGEGCTAAMYLVIAAFSALRMYAIYNKSRRVLALVLLMGIANPCLSLYYSTALTIQAMPPPFRGCGQQSKFHNPNIDLTLFVFGGTSSILTEAIALILTWIRLAGIMGTLRTFKLQIGVSRMICIDGTLYSSVLLVLLGMDMLSIPDQSFNNIPALTDTLASISLSRFILNLRAISLASEGNTCSAPSSVVFNSKRESSYLVGNLGATLRAFDDDDNDEGEEMDASSAIIDICTDGPFNQWVSDDPFMAGIIADAMASSCKSSCSTLDGQ